MNIEIANRLVSLRKANHLSQEELAKKCGVSRQTVNAIENDKYNPTLELAMKIGKLLNRHVDDIFFLED